MITRDKGELVVICNECGDREYGGTWEWNQFIQQIKRSGWRIEKESVDGGEHQWSHYCPSCKDSY